MSNYPDEEDVIIESSSSGPGTPMEVSKGSASMTSDMVEMRNTPPPPRSSGVAASMPHSSSSPSLGASNRSSSSMGGVSAQTSQSKYGQLLAVIEDMGKDIRPTYAGSKTSTERLKRSIMHARILVRECLMECDRASRM